MAERRRRRRARWLPRLVVAAALVGLFVPIPASWVDGTYARAYPVWQRTVTPAFDGLPWAPFDLWLGLAVVGAVASVVGGYRRPGRGRIRSALVAAWWLAVFGSAVYLWFMASWGLNYRRIPLTARLDFDRHRVTAAAVHDLAARSVAELNRLHPLAWAGGWPEWSDVPALLAPAVAPVSTALGLPAGPRPGTPRRTLLQPYLRWSAVDAVTDPFLLDIVVNDDLLPVERLETVAHEWGHLAGLAREAEASYFGWRLCQAGDARAQYSAWLAVYGHAMRAVTPGARAPLMQALEAGPRRDLRAIAARYERVVPVVRDAAWSAYDRYLKSNRVPEGVASYDDLLVLILGINPAP